MFRFLKGYFLALSIFCAALIFLAAPVSAQSPAPDYPAYGTYNGFLNQLNILECDNLNETASNALLEIFSNKGTLVKSLNIATSPNGSSHVILNDQADINDTYGTFRVSLNNNEQAPYFNCRAVFYKPSASSSAKSYDFTYAMPLKNSSQGELSGVYNSVNPLGKNSATQNWLSIVNTSRSFFSAEVQVYSQDGKLERKIPVNGLAPLGRVDIGLGHEDGQKNGVYKIVPKYETQDYQAFLMRYGLEESGAGFSFAFPLDAKEGSCNGARLQASTMASAHTQNWLVLGNSGENAIRVTVEINDRAGAALKKQLVSVPAFRQSHILLNPVIDPAGTGNVGSVKLSCQTNGSNLLAQTSFYGSNDLQSVSWAYVEQAASQPQIASGQQLSFAINTFLNMGNWIKIAQNEDKTTPLDFSFYDSRGLLQLSGTNNLAPSGTIDFDVHSNFPKDKVGSANFKLKNSSSVSGYLLRTIPDNQGRIGNIIYIPGSILPEEIKPKFSENSFSGDSQSLTPYKDRLSTQEIDYFLTRTSFGGSTEEKAEFFQKGLAGSVSSMLNTKNPSTNIFLEDPSDIDWNEPKVAWMRMMIEGDNPFHEKMALIWHDLFATSCKAGGTTLNCFTHIELLRRNALGNFRTLAQEITIDYTMLEWLNGTRNTKEAPDENFSREFWELFTLGETSKHTGPYRLYNNQDIEEASRSFTGWQTWIGGEPHTVGFKPYRFDDGEKIIWQGTPYEVKGNFNNEDIVNLTLDIRPESAEWIAKRLFSALVHDSPEPEVVQQIAQTLVNSNWDVKPALQMILRSEAMFSEEARHKRVKDAVTYLVGFLRRTEIPYRHDRFTWNFSHQYTGYEPTQPISVAGWPINKYKGASKSAYFLSWLTGYANFLNRMVDGLPNDFKDFDHQSLIPKSRFQPTAPKIVDELSEVLGVELNAAERAILINYVSTEKKWDGELITLDLINNKEGLDTKIRGTLWFLTQHRDYLTY